jgi:hypothetical protein
LSVTEQSWTGSAHPPVRQPEDRPGPSSGG